MDWEVQEGAAGFSSKSHRGKPNTVIRGLRSLEKLRENKEKTKEEEGNCLRFANPAEALGGRHSEA